MRNGRKRSPYLRQRLSPIVASSAVRMRVCKGLRRQSSPRGVSRCISCASNGQCARARSQAGAAVVISWFLVMASSFCFWTSAVVCRNYIMWLDGSAGAGSGARCVGSLVGEPYTTACCMLHARMLCLCMSACPHPACAAAPPPHACSCAASPAPPPITACITAAARGGPERDARCAKAGCHTNFQFSIE